MEDLRDEKLSFLIGGFQAQLRWYMAQTDKKRRVEQRAGLLIVQRNVRSWCTLRTWEWFKLYGKVKPMLKAGKEHEEMEKIAAKMKELEENLAKEEKMRKELEENYSKLVADKQGVFGQLESTKTQMAELEERSQKLDSLKKDLEKQLAVR